MRRIMLTLAGVSALVLNSPAITAAGDTVIYVDSTTAGPPHDGTTWCQAYTDLQQALSAARSSGGAIAEIRVAAGTYRPDAPGGDPAAAFELFDGVAVLGGYAGCNAPSPNARNIHQYETTLSGDLNGDDGPGFTNISDNSFNVVVGSGTGQSAILDGFTVTGGNADGEFLDAGGGMINDGGSPTVGNCKFVRNVADFDGGGMYNVNFSSPALINVTFLENVADYGGGMYNRDGSSPILINCRFLGNEGSRSGGGMRNQDGSHPQMHNCIFSGNFTILGPANGGAIYNDASSPDLFNCTLANNSTAFRGGAMYNTNSSGPELDGCILWGNFGSAVDGIAIRNSSSTLVRCSIVEGGVAGVDADAGSSLVWDGATNLTGDPIFRSSDGPDADPGTLDDDLRVLPASPALDPGCSNVTFACRDTDLDNMPRVLCGTADMGAYEFGAGDFNCDRLINLEDFASFINCVKDSAASGCEAFYFDGNDCNITLADFGRFQDLFGNL